MKIYIYNILFVFLVYSPNLCQRSCVSYSVVSSDLCYQYQLHIEKHCILFNLRRSFLTHICLHVLLAFVTLTLDTTTWFMLKTYWTYITASARCNTIQNSSYWHIQLSHLRLPSRMMWSWYNNNKIHNFWDFLVYGTIMRCITYYESSVYWRKQESDFLSVRRKYIRRNMLRPHSPTWAGTCRYLLLLDNR